MFKKIGLGVLVLGMQSCIPIHTAKRIPTHEITESKHAYVDLQAYSFEYDGNYNQFPETVKRFFDLSSDANVYEFTTDNLIENKSVKVFISSSSDRTQYIDLVGFFLDNNDDEEETETEQDRRIREQREKERNKIGEINYLFVQLMDENGTDLLAEDGFLKSIAMQKLKQFQVKINQ